MKENFKEYKLETRDDFIIYLRYPTRTKTIVLFQIVPQRDGT